MLLSRFHGNSQKYGANRESVALQVFYAHYAWRLNKNYGIVIQRVTKMDAKLRDVYLDLLLYRICTHVVMAVAAMNVVALTVYIFTTTASRNSYLVFFLFFEFMMVLGPWAAAHERQSRVFAWPCRMGNASIRVAHKTCTLHFAVDFKRDGWKPFPWIFALANLSSVIEATVFFSEVFFSGSVLPHTSKPYKDIHISSLVTL
eukprot:SAG31_NODE_3818_length_3853_cov_10.567395_6_plen_201_part_01